MRRTAAVLLLLGLARSLAAASSEEASEESQLSASAPSSEAPGALAGIEDPHTLSQLLHWSLENQDLSVLHRKAEGIRQGGGDADDGALPAPTELRSAASQSVPSLTAERKAELNALAQDLMPDMVAQMRDALANATDTSLDEDSREEALLFLQDLVEDIDHARDLQSLGGFEEVVPLLASGVGRLQAAAAYVLGSAVKSHRELQLLLLSSPHALSSLLALLRSHESPDVRAKMVYAVASLLRNNPEAQAAFAAADGIGTLLAVLSEAGEAGGAASKAHDRLKKKALVLVTDLMREQRQLLSSPTEEAPTAGIDGEPVRVSIRSAGDGHAVREEVVSDGAAVQGIGSRDVWRNSSELCAIVAEGLGRMDDLDAQEKALQALEQMAALGLLDAASSGSPQVECSPEVLRSALRSYRERCERAIAGAERAEVPEDEDGTGACEEMIPVAEALEHIVAAGQ